ncbi:MAG: hypothetical protein AAF067_07330 [Pseudomonadota bacterium]
MGLLFDAKYYSLLSLIGFGWTILTFWLMFSERGRFLLSSPWSILIAAAAMVPSIWYVASEVGRLTELSGGIPPLDAQYGYGKVEIAAFASALGADGRDAYAAFQLGADTLAPPAFVCFLMSVFRSTVKLKVPLILCSVLAFTYFGSVLLANSLMPVIIIHFPTESGPLLSALYGAVPVMDWLKYSAHASTWLVIFIAWIWQCAGWVRSRT